MTPRGALMYEGPSRLTGGPIFVVATGLATPSSNRKTGPMVQVWIVTAESPLTSVWQGRDASVCGSCRHRPSEGGACYVNLKTGPQRIWYTHERGGYPAADLGWFAGRRVRFGAWGDPAAVPLRVWQPLLEVVDAWTGYTHQWPDLDVDAWGWLMASVDTVAERAEARAAGWRTFRVHRRGTTLLPGEIACPASDEAGHRTTCFRCRLCNGVRPGVRDIAIEVHGRLRSRFPTGQLELWRAA